MINIDEVSYTLFPHLRFLLNLDYKNMYIIDASTLFREIPFDETKKAKYNVFYSFGVEYMSILLDSYLTGKIGIKTFNQIKKDNKSFIETLFQDYYILKKPCSYLLDDIDDYLNVFYNYDEIEADVYNKLCPYQLTEDERDLLKLKKRIYLYGAGYYARRWYVYLKWLMFDIEGFVVSSKNDNPSDIYGLIVYELSAVIASDDMIIIPALVDDYDSAVALLKDNNICVFDWKKG